jgi:hypothetical protein
MRGPPGDFQRKPLRDSLVASSESAMNSSFLPGDLHLSKNASGLFIVALRGQEVLSTKSQRSAIAKFNALRAELEEKFPMRELSAEEKIDLCHQVINNSLVGHNSLGGRKKKTTAGGTRTFGG